MLRSIHGFIFSSTFLDFAGNFRTDHVEVGHGINKFDGTPPSLIDIQMERLFEEVFPKKLELLSLDKNSFLKKCAMFMEDMLRIHPFSDGNGRVTRLLLLYLAQNTEAFRFKLPSDRKSNKKYVTALEYAHRHVRQKNHGDGEKKYPFTYLIKWLADILEDYREASDLSNDEPDWLKK